MFKNSFISDFYQFMLFINADIYFLNVQTGNSKQYFIYLRYHSNVTPPANLLNIDLYITKLLLGLYRGLLVFYSVRCLIFTATKFVKCFIKIRIGYNVADASVG